MPKENKSGLEELKKGYKILEEKYHLPGFEAMNNEFYIEKIAEAETEVLTREIRRFIADKVFNYLRFVETLLNPVNAPMFIFSVIKSLTSDDKKKLSDIYTKLSQIDLELIKLDVDSSEKEDAEFIKRFYESWQQTKKELTSIIEKLSNVREQKEDRTNGGYFG
ncbi:MAG: hypothetical protein M1165_02115 [Candidatus Pacearchaeota archaeon]|nr:hypothetical protein [Candidatus Pacearchaeota archaeon]MDE1848756.1 hypothetical protein [Nanoarchaeota archaeon]